MSANKQKSKSPDRMTKAELLEALKEAREKMKQQSQLLKESREQNVLLEEKLEELGKAKDSVERETGNVEKKPDETSEQRENHEENMPIFKHSFRIDFYDEREGLLRGKIEHLLTKKKKAFKGFDAGIISSFIQDNVPALKTPQVEAKPAKIEETQQQARPLKKELATIKEKLQFKEVTIVPLGFGKNRPTKLIDNGFRYQAQLEADDLQKIQANNILICARPINGNQRYFIGQTPVKAIDKPEAIRIEINPASLSPGTYRLTAAMDSQSAETGNPVITDVSKSSLIQVL